MGRSAASAIRSVSMELRAERPRLYRQLRATLERQRHGAKPAGRSADELEVVLLRVVVQRDRPATHLRRHDLDHLERERGAALARPAVDQREIDRPAKIAQALARIPGADLDPLGQARIGEVAPRGGDLGWHDFRADDPAAAVVTQRRGKVERGKPDRGCKIHDPPGIERAAQKIDELTLVRVERETVLLVAVRIVAATAAGAAAARSAPRGDQACNHPFDARIVQRAQRGAHIGCALGKGHQPLPRIWAAAFKRIAAMRLLSSAEASCMSRSARLSSRRAAWISFESPPSSPSSPKISRTRPILRPMCSSWLSMASAASWCSFRNSRPPSVML